MLGCGNSKLSQEVSDQTSKPTFFSVLYRQMWDDGYKNIVNVDVSAPGLGSAQA